MTRSSPNPDITVFPGTSTSQPGLALLSALACDARSSPVSSSMRRALPNLGGSRTLLPARHAGGPAPKALNGLKKFNQIKKEISFCAFNIMYTMWQTLPSVLLVMKCSCEDRDVSTASISGLCLLSHFLGRPQNFCCKRT